MVIVAIATAIIPTRQPLNPPCPVADAALIAVNVAAGFDIALDILPIRPDR
jgi:hypothetical protein